MSDRVDEVPDYAVRLARDRRAMLWVCQRYDLEPGEEPHDYGVPEPEAALRYRPGPSPVDTAVANSYWEAIWLEGAGSPILAAIRAVTDSRPSAVRRSVAVLASDADAEADISSQEFLPVAVLPGLLKTGAADARYGVRSARNRERTAWALTSRLASLPGRLLVVIGAESESDLSRLREAIEDLPIIDLSLLVVWPPEKALPTDWDLAVPAKFWRGSISTFIDVLRRSGAPRGDELPEWSIRIGAKRVQLGPRDVRPIIDRFLLLTERELLPPQTFELADLQDFLAGSLDNWKAFAAGLPVQRSYRSGDGLSLQEEVLKALEALKREVGGSRTHAFELPSDGGSGATTMIRQVAHSAAGEGYPTVLLKPGQVDVDLEDVIGFATTLSEACLAAGITEMPPMLVVLDTEHARILRARQIPQRLAAQGRSVVVLQAVEREDDDAGERRSANRVHLRALNSEVSAAEVERCRIAISRLAERWALPIAVPTEADWNSYRASTQWRSYSEGGDDAVLFWVLLRFFLTEGMDFSTADKARSAMSEWIGRRLSIVTTKAIADVLDFVAALSSARIVSPLWTVLRPVTGGAFPSELAATLRELNALVVWGEFSEDLDDQVLRFAHPVLGEEYLRRRGIAIDHVERFRLLEPVIHNLSPGHSGDMWVAEALTTPLVPPYEERRFVTDWEWRLGAFESLPPVVSGNSKSILHAWGRCLYLSADRRRAGQLSPSDRRARLETAVEKLTRATSLPRRIGRDEHPSHLFTSLGTAYARLADFHQELNDQAERDHAWSKAKTAFEQAIIAAEGTNIEALLAFAERLVRHAQGSEGRPSDQSDFQELAQALALLDGAAEAFAQWEIPDQDWESSIAQLRTESLSLLDTAEARKFIVSLKNSADPALGFYCEARLALREPESGPEHARAILEEAERSNIALGQQGTTLLLSLLRADPAEQFNFKRLRHLYRVLESQGGTPTPNLDAFRHAVICYQVGEYLEGSERFKRLRDQVRRSGLAPIRVRDVWRDEVDPTKPRVTQARVTRVLTEWRADAYIEELRQSVPLRPRHFSPPPRVNEFVYCVIRFEINGPLAVPPRFEAQRAAPLAARRIG